LLELALAHGVQNLGPSNQEDPMTTSNKSSRPAQIKLRTKVRAGGLPMNHSPCLYRAG